MEFAGVGGRSLTAVRASIKPRQFLLELIPLL
jgi:hypothetical protein